MRSMLQTVLLGCAPFILFSQQGLNQSQKAEVASSSDPEKDEASGEKADSTQQEEITIIGAQTDPASKELTALDADTRLAVRIWSEMVKIDEKLAHCLPSPSQGGTPWVSYEVQSNGTIEKVSTAGSGITTKEKKCISTAIGTMNIGEEKLEQPQYVAWPILTSQEAKKTDAAATSSLEESLDALLTSIEKACSIPRPVGFMVGTASDGTVRFLSSSETGTLKTWTRECMVNKMLDWTMKPLEPPLVWKLYRVTIAPKNEAGSAAGIALKAAAYHFDKAHKQYYGARPKKDIRAVVTKHLNEFRACYESSMKTDGTFSTRIVVGFAIGADGSVLEALVEKATSAHPEFHACMEEKFKALQFGPALGGGIVIVHYPFVFMPLEKPGNSQAKPPEGSSVSP